MPNTTVLLLVVLVSLIPTAEAAPAGQSDADSEWLQYLHGYTPPQSPVRSWSPQQPSTVASQPYGSFGLHDASTGYWAPAGGHVDPHQAHDSHFWGGHSYHAQQSQPWHDLSAAHPSIRQQDVPNTPQEVTQEDLDFLHTVLSDPESSERSPSAEPQEAAGSPSMPSAKTKIRKKRKTIPLFELNRPFDQKWQNKLKKQAQTLRAKKNWPEPEALQALDYYPPLREQGKAGDLLNEKDVNIAKHINERVFSNRFNWVDDRLFGYLQPNGAFRTYWPVRRPSRRLPSVSTTAPDGTKLSVHITNVGILENKHMKGTVLDGIPYYQVWGVPEEPRTVNPIVYYGAGYIKPQDNVAIDRHLSSLEVASNEAAKLHL